MALLPARFRRARLRNTFAKRVLPRSLLARSLLMILLPLLILEGVALQIFYGGHIDLVSRRMSGAVAGELAFTISMMQRYPDLEDVDWILARARDAFGFDIALRPGEQLATTQSVNVLGP